LLRAPAIGMRIAGKPNFSTNLWVFSELLEK
jgi:hypothetical protein